MSEPTIDFEKVELVRERMALTVKDMCKLLDVSRVTYYKWVGGGPIRPRNVQTIRYVLRKVLPHLKSGAWPPPGAKNWTSEQRLDALLEVLEGDG